MVCSDMVGARQVVESDPCLGSVFTSGTSFIACLQDWIAKGPRTPQQRARIGILAESVEPATAASYFLKLMDHIYAGGPRPYAPWDRSNPQPGPAL